MERINTFQIVVLGIFSVMIIVGLLGFSGRLPLPSGKQSVNYGEVTIWGTLPAAVMQPIIADKLLSDRSIKINYVAKNAATFNTDLVEALAAGKGPDLFSISQQDILRNLNKMALIPYTTVTERAFKDTFIQEGELFMRPDGIVALPFTIDPMVMYWNRDIFTNAGIVAPPTKWSEFYTMVPRVVTRDSSGNITRGFAALGEFRNVLHAKDLISTIMLQAGSPIVTNQNGYLTSSLVTTAAEAAIQGGSTTAQTPATNAINFYTQFARADKDSYTWNRSLPYSRSMFEAGDLALYFGYASEYNAIKQKNPHLNFDVAVVPQADNASLKKTFGQIQGFAVARSSQNPAGAMHAAVLLAGSDVIGTVALKMGLPPVRRDLLAVRPTDAVASVFYDSAIITSAWIDPSSSETDQLFQQMIDSISSGQQKVTEALNVLQSGINKLLQSYR